VHDTAEEALHTPSMSQKVELLPEFLMNACDLHGLLGDDADPSHDA